MRAMVPAVLVLLGVTACSDNEYVCVDVLEEGEGTEIVENFVGVEVCYYVFADDKTCEDEGGTADDVPLRAKRAHKRARLILLAARAKTRPGLNGFV